MEERLYRITYKKDWDSMNKIMESRIVSVDELERINCNKNIKVESIEPFRLNPDYQLDEY
jgi:hypothetical protein